MRIRFLLLAGFAIWFNQLQATIATSLTLQNNQSGCAPFAISASATTNSSAPIVSYQWLLTMCNGDTVFNAIPGTANTFSYVLQCNDTCGCYKLTVTAINQANESAAATSPAMNVYCPPQLSPVITSDCSQPPSLVLHPNVVNKCGQGIDSIKVDWGCGPIDIFNTNVDSVVRIPNCANGCYSPVILAWDSHGCLADTTLANGYCLPGNAIVPKGYVSLDTIPCPNPPTIIQFFDTTPGNFVSWLWDFGDSSFSTLDTATNIYNFPSNYPVRLTLTNAQGCSGTSIIDTIVFGGPYVDYTVTTYELCACLDSAHIVLHTVGASDLVFLYGCNTGFGQFGPISPVGTPATPADLDFYVPYCLLDSCQPQIILTDSANCQVSLTLPYLYIDSPKVNFSNTTLGTCAGGTTCFTDLTTYALDVTQTVSRQWNFGDGSPVDTSSSPCHKYTQAGFYQVQLVVWSSGGCIDSMVLPVEIYSSPVSSFTYAITDTACNSAAVCLTNTSQPASANDTLTKVWGFIGEGSSPPLLINNICHGYFAEGTYQVSLKVTDQRGCFDVDTQSVAFTIHHLSSFISVVSLDDSCYSSTVCLHDSSISEGGQITQRLWTFGNQGVIVSGTDTCYTLSTAGPQVIDFEVSDNTGCTVHKTLSVNPQFHHPVASFTYAVSGNNVMFLNTSTGAADSILWDFGNGTNTNSFNTTQTFQFDSTYNVTLTMLDRTSGCFDTAMQTIIMPADTTTDTTNIGIKDLRENIRIHVAPNPFTDYTRVEIEGALRNVTLQLTNLLGEEVSTPVTGFNGTYNITRDGLPGGVYVLSVMRSATVLGKYKLVIQ